MSKPWPRVQLGEVLLSVDRAVPTNQLTEIDLAGVYSFGNGLFKRGKLAVAGTSYKKYNQLVTGDFVISQPKAWEGAVALVTPEFEGWFLSPVFPVFSANTENLSPHYLSWYCRQPKVWDQIQAKSKGMGARRETVSVDQFLSLEIPLPSIDQQRRIVARIDAIQQHLQQADTLRSSIDYDIASLLAVRFQETQQHAEWLPMQDVAPIVRRDVTLDPQSNYAELGIRSFGKGTFHKPTLSGIELGSKRVYRIEPGDLLFSNVFAWEGAIAVAKPDDTGRVGSHRFISCVPHSGLVTAEYLRYYFLTDEGMSKIRDASPGGAGRNRTLGLAKLLALTVPIPPIQIQQQFVALQAELSRLAQVRTDEAAQVAAVVPALIARTMQGNAPSPATQPRIEE